MRRAYQKDLKRRPCWEGQKGGISGRNPDIKTFINHKVIIDYRDSQIPFPERQVKQQQRVYKKLLKMDR